MTRTTVGPRELAASVNGFDDLAVAKYFGKSFSQMASRDENGERDVDGSVSLRALIFIDQRRQGAKDAAAWQTCMEITITELGTYFPAEEDEVTPDDPATDLGKDSMP
ncbi:hypothetical protein [Nocardioides yefusunii]|uniref:Uncharacterized protein n=1 Tax=Nocardioides yefusunii TaxID=2500546 RepID=A0ABW1QW40_9ACTN|nr:hypothetical protein [Nocardioides yefusunii]